MKYRYVFGESTRREDTVAALYSETKKNIRISKLLVLEKIKFFNVLQ